MVEISKPEPVDSVNMAFIRSVARMLGYDIDDRSNGVTEMHFFPDRIEVHSVNVTAPPIRDGYPRMIKNIAVRRPLR